MEIGKEANERLVENRRIERELEDARAELERAHASSRAKDVFLAILGHELRNPLAPISTAIALLRMRGTQARELDVIERQAGHLTRLVDDLLDISRIARGKVDLRREHVEIASVVVRAVEMTSPLIEQRRHEMRIDVPATGLAVDGDPARLAQVISNLVTNAAKYSEPGSPIAIEARPVDARARISIKDRGIGLTAEMRAEIFEVFIQESQSLDRASGGLGLGLAIVRGLVELHGGRVDARSEGLGEGSEFVVDLPLARYQRSIPPPRTLGVETRIATANEQRVLVVDDNIDGAELLATLLGEWGYEVEIATDGPRALAIAERFIPHVCLVDIGLPLMDGYELARRLRAMTQLGPDLRLIAVTGYGQRSDQRRAAQAGFCRHLTKPVTPELLVSALDAD